MKHVVLVRHNSYLFKGNVEENLRMAKPDATKEEMEAVLQKVNLLGFLQTQNGLQTELLEKAGVEIPMKKQETSPAASASVL